MNVLFVPSIGLDTSLIERLAASVDYPIKWKACLNNGPTGALERFREQNRDWIVREPSVGNRGVAGSWNDAAKMFPDEPSILLMNEDAFFFPGQLEAMCKCMDEYPDAPVVHINETLAYYCFGWLKIGRDKFGIFDENLWPGYMEDNDMRVRHRLLGVTEYPYALPDSEPVPHGKPRTGGVNYTAMLQGCGLLNRTYWLRKWGSLDFDKATYETPYKDHRLTVKDVVWYPEHRAKLFPIWQAFMEMNPSLYD